MKTEIVRVALYVIAAWFALGTACLAWLAGQMRSVAVVACTCLSAGVVGVLLAAAGDLR